MNLVLVVIIKLLFISNHVLSPIHKLYISSLAKSFDVIVFHLPGSSDLPLSICLLQLILLAYKDQISAFFETQMKLMSFHFVSPPTKTVKIVEISNVTFSIRKYSSEFFFQKEVKQTDHNSEISDNTPANYVHRSLAYMAFFLLSFLIQLLQYFLASFQL